MAHTDIFDFRERTLNSDGTPSIKGMVGHNLFITIIYVLLL